VVFFTGFKNLNLTVPVLSAFLSSAKMKNLKIMKTDIFSGKIKMMNIHRPMAAAPKSITVAVTIQKTGRQPWPN
jgi:hypothetical protein